MLASLQAYLWVALGGGFGAMGRHGLGQITLKTFGPGFPVGTMSANILGGFLMGVLAGWLTTKSDPDGLRLFLGVGVLGGFTTFSAFSLDAWRMIEEQRYGIFAAYAGGSVILSIAALAIGLFFARQVFS